MIEQFGSRIKKMNCFDWRSSSVSEMFLHRKYNGINLQIALKPEDWELMTALTDWLIRTSRTMAATQQLQVS